MQCERGQDLGSGTGKKIFHLLGRQTFQLIVPLCEIGDPVGGGGIQHIVHLRNGEENLGDKCVGGAEVGEHGFCADHLHVTGHPADWRPRSGGLCFGRWTAPYRSG